jgi:hypothetical protein
MDEVIVSAASFLVIRLSGQEQERRRKKLPQKRRWWMTTVFKSRDIYSGSDLLEDLGVKNLRFKTFCRMPTPCSARVQKVDRSRLVIVHMTRAACREPLWCTDNKRSPTNQWLVRRVLLVSWLVMSSTLLASIASHTSTSNVDGPLRNTTTELPRCSGPAQRNGSSKKFLSGDKMYTV